MPDNRMCGMLETFLAYILPDANEVLWQFSQETTQEAKKKGAPFKDSHYDKANIYTLAILAKSTRKAVAPSSYGADFSSSISESPELHKLVQDSLQFAIEKIVHSFYPVILLDLRPNR